MESSLVLSNEHVPVVKVHALPLFGVLNHLARGERQSRVIGTLLGVKQEGSIEITDSFGVPHMEKSEELFVAINKDYHKSMYSFHRRVHKKEVIVGWYTTALPEGSLVIDSSSLIHDFYANDNECENPVHLVVDTSLPSGADAINVKAYISQPMMLGDDALANMFQEIKVEFVFTESEKICLYNMIRNQLPAREDNSVILSEIPKETDNVVSSMSLLVSLLDKITKYVDEVVSGAREANPDVGIMLADVMGSLQVVDPEKFLSYFADKTQDMLMVSYISSLTSTQLAVAERLIRLL